MEGLGVLSADLSTIWDQLVLGYDLFGSYAALFWIMPIVWVIAGLSIWAYMSWQQRQSDRAYLDFASRQLPILRRIARQRAHEVAFSRRLDRF